jgi:2-polyprenyl-3-methyl-5-hydroxy-6-metoxy-1,4-benzoquinol methylase
LNPSERLEARPLAAMPPGADWELSRKELESYARYRGLAVHADSIEVHQEALLLLERHGIPGGRVLDVGAGSGAFSLRLLDHGFARVEAIEVRGDAFKVPGVEVHALDLDGPWSSGLGERFDAVAALEVIEHLENPWHFARQCAAAVKPGGVVVISTPNIESSRSRLEFLLKAEFRFFKEKDYRTVGHLTSLTAKQVERVFERAGLDLVERRPSRHKGFPWPGSARKALRAFLYALSYPLMAGARRGEVSIFLFRRPAGSA